MTPAGRVRTVVSHTQAHGGQLLAAAWVTPAPGVRYRAPQAVDGVFAGGPVQELAADGSRVAFVACAGVSAWTPSTGTVDSLQTAFACLAPYARGHLYSLALAGDRVAWWEKSWGLCFNWRAREATLGATSIDIDAGTGCLGGPPLDGSGTAVGAGDLLVRSSWKLHWSGEPRVVVDEQTVERIDPGGCPCPALSSSPGPYTPLDVDSGRIVVSGENETRILDADGKVLLTLPVPTLAAQLSGADLVVAPGDELRVYDASTGALRSTWPLPAAAGHDCDAFGDPTCLLPPALTLEDVSRGLAAYVVDGKVHVLRLSDGVDVVVAAGVRARFLDAGLAYADGARIRLLPWGQLPLR